MNPYPLASLNHLTAPRCFKCGRPPSGPRWYGRLRDLRRLRAHSSRRSHRLEAVPTVDRLSRRGAERNLRRHAARGADGLVELSSGRYSRHLRRATGNPGTSVALLFVSTPAAAGRFVLETALLVKRLLARCKDELFATVATFQYSVFFGHETSVTPSPV